MSWWKKLFGGKRDSAVPASFDVATPFPVAVEIVPGELSARVHLHEIRAASGLVPCWSYVSAGLRAHQQREVVFTLRREAGEPAASFPEEPFKLFRTLHRLAAQGQRVTVGGHSELGTTRFFGHHVLYADAQPLQGARPCAARRHPRSTHRHVRRSRSPAPPARGVRRVLDGGCRVAIDG